jgi:hypothetical protein
VLTLKFGLIFPQFFGASGSEFRLSLAAVDKWGARSLHPGVISGKL